MAFHLEQNLNLPLEREHEGWTIRGIEDYATTLGLAIKVCAVSPTDEKKYGLQTRRWSLGQSSLGFSSSAPILLAMKLSGI